MKNRDIAVYRLRLVATSKYGLARSEKGTVFIAAFGVENTIQDCKEYWKLCIMRSCKVYESYLISNTNFLNLDMKAVVINPKDNAELKFVTDLLKKLGIKATEITQEEMEDLAMSKLLKRTDRSKKATKAEIMRKLGA